jgi:hypothetical protein
MNHFRQAHSLSRFVLVWFALSLGVAIASPWVSPQSVELVCTTGGAMKLISSDAADDSVASVQNMDCALCMPVVFAPTPIAFQFIKPSPLSHALKPIAEAYVAAVTAPPLPSRGPPSL